MSVNHLLPVTYLISGKTGANGAINKSMVIRKFKYICKSSCMNIRTYRQIDQQRNSCTLHLCGARSGSPKLLCEFTAETFGNVKEVLWKFMCTNRNIIKYTMNYHFDFEPFSKIWSHM